MYKKCFAQRKGGNTYLIHLWTDEGYQKVEWVNQAYVECGEADATHLGLGGEPLKKVRKWDKENNKLHFHDMTPYQKFLVERYGIDDEPSTTHREIFFDIETEWGDALTEEYIKSAPKKVTSIAWYDKQVDEWGILILDKKSQLSRTKAKNKEIIPCATEDELLLKFLEKFREIDPDIIVGWNSDYFDVPYLYYRMCKVLGEDVARYLSPIGYVRETPWYKDQYIQIAGVESLDYMRLHKKFSWADEPSFKLDAIGEKYVGMKKIEYEGNLDDLFEADIHKFIQYNFVDVEILKLLDEKLEYLSLVKNLAHKGKHNYSEVYANTKTQDGAISAYLLSEGIVPPAKERNPLSKKNYAGGYLFCPKAGIYNYVFDEDLTSLYPSIIMTINIGKETMVGRIIDADDRNNRLGLNDLLKRDPEEELMIENAKRNRTRVSVRRLISMIQQNELSISANGVMFATNRESVLSTILKKWFDERVLYKNEMKAAFTSGNKELGAKFHMRQYTQKILLNSLYGALALGSFRYGNVILAEATTLSGQRIIQESALTANRHINKVIGGEVSLFERDEVLKHKPGEKMTVVGTDYSLGTSEILEKNNTQ
jgi:DNA polymerase elongation subunit (family B)